MPPVRASAALPGRVRVRAAALESGPQLPAESVPALALAAREMVARRAPRARGRSRLRGSPRLWTVAVQMAVMGASAQQASRARASPSVARAPARSPLVESPRPRSGPARAPRAAEAQVSALARKHERPHARARAAVPEAARPQASAVVARAPVQARARPRAQAWGSVGAGEQASVAPLPDAAAGRVRSRDLAAL